MQAAHASSCLSSRTRWVHVGSAELTANVENVVIAEIAEISEIVATVIHHFRIWKSVAVVAVRLWWRDKKLRSTGLRVGLWSRLESQVSVDQVPVA